MLYTGSRCFGDEILRINLRITIQEYEKYLPAGKMHLLEDDIKPGEKRSDLRGGHIGGSDENHSWIYKCAVLNNEVYPCETKEDQKDLHEFYEYVMGAMYEKMTAEVHELNVKPSYGDDCDME